MAKFKEMISNASLEDFYKTTDPNHALSTFYKIYNNAYNKCFPLQILSNKRANDKKWITSGLKISIWHKDKLFKLYIHINLILKVELN